MGLLNKYSNILDQIMSCRSLQIRSKDGQEILWALSNICAGTEKDRRSMMESGLFPKVIQLLKEAPYSVSKEALWTLSNATNDRDKQIVDPLMEMGMMEAICHFLKAQKSTILQYYN